MGTHEVKQMVHSDRFKKTCMGYVKLIYMCIFDASALLVLGVIISQYLLHTGTCRAWIKLSQICPDNPPPKKFP